MSLAQLVQDHVVELTSALAGLTALDVTGLGVAVYQYAQHKRQEKLIKRHYEEFFKQYLNNY